MTIDVKHGGTRDEGQRLTTMVNAGLSDPQIAVDLGRAVQAVSAQRVLAGLKPNRAI